MCGRSQQTAKRHQVSCPEKEFISVVTNFQECIPYFAKIASSYLIFRLCRCSTVSFRVVQLHFDILQTWLVVVWRNVLQLVCLGLLLKLIVWLLDLFHVHYRHTIKATKDLRFSTCYQLAFIDNRKQKVAILYSRAVHDEFIHVWLRASLRKKTFVSQWLQIS